MTFVLRSLRVGVVAGAVALAGCGGGGSETSLPERELALDGGRALHLPVRASALFGAGDIDRDGVDDLIVAAGRDDELYAWTSRRRSLTRVVGTEGSDTSSGTYPIAVGAGGIVLAGARLRWVAARRTWPAPARPVVLDPGRQRTGLPDEPLEEHFAAQVVEERDTAQTRRLRYDVVDYPSRAMRAGLAVIDRTHRRVTLLDIRDGQIRARAIPNVGIADKDDGVAILHPNGEVELVQLP